MILDYHMHLRTPRADVEEIDHTVDAVERYVAAARTRGVDEIGFTEHVYYFRQTAGIWDVPYQADRCVYDLDAYVDAVLEAKGRGLPVKLGLEVDWVPSRAEELDAILRPYPWDYLLCSLHYVAGRGIDARPSLVEAVGVDEAWERYFDELVAAARTGRFDVLAHPDLIKFFGDEPSCPDAWPDRVASAVAAAGVCLEVSTAGKHKPHGRLYPDAPLLAAARRHGIPITLASDAHAPDNVGRDLPLAVEHARAAGYDTVTVFDHRTARQEPLP
jgi:histidinol-phosphatase (PHP family)